MAELSFLGLEGASCSLQISVTATQSIDQCLEDIEINNTSKHTCTTQPSLCCSHSYTCSLL